jgi:hypothetical protein
MCVLFFFFLSCRLNQIYAKFDEVKHSGGMLATADFGECMKIQAYTTVGKLSILEYHQFHICHINGWILFGENRYSTIQILFNDAILFIDT